MKNDDLAKKKPEDEREIVSPPAQTAGGETM